jgi:uncharacterized cupin superfamily protein
VFGKGKQFGTMRAPFSPKIGARKLGYGVIRLEPGKRASPYRSHYVTEELFDVLKGEGNLRRAGHEYPIRAGFNLLSSGPGAGAQDHQYVWQRTRLHRAKHPGSDRHFPVSGLI